MDRKKIIIKFLKRQCITFPNFENHFAKYSEEMIDAWENDLKECKSEHLEIAINEMFKSATKPLLPIDVIYYCKELQGQENKKRTVDVWSEEFWKNGRSNE